jgi:ribosomal protein L37AE/L43A
MSTFVSDETVAGLNVKSVEVLSGGGEWVLKNDPKGHKCVLPEVSLPAGSLWKCNECGQHWRVSNGRGKNAGSKTMRRLTDEMAAKKLAKKNGKV